MELLSEFRAFENWAHTSPCPLTFKLFTSQQSQGGGWQRSPSGAKSSARMGARCAQHLLLLGRSPLPLRAGTTSPASQEHKEEQHNGSCSLLQHAGARMVQEFTDAFSERFHPCAAPVCESCHVEHTVLPPRGAAGFLNMVGFILKLV